MKWAEIIGEPSDSVGMEKVNLDRSIFEKEKYMILLEEQVNQYKKMRINRFSFFL